ncbi:hypothetical protein J7643_08975 [bacterium]|nr:hypothetical protein [bacterium]
MAGIDSNYLFKLTQEDEERRKLLLQALARVNAQRQEAATAVTEDEEQANALGSGLLDLSYYADSFAAEGSGDRIERMQQAIARAQGVGDGLTATGDTLFQNLAATLAGFEPNR